MFTTKIAAIVINNKLTPSTTKRVYELNDNGLDMDIYPGIYHHFFMKNLLLKLCYLLINLPLRIAQIIKIVLTKKYEIVLIHKKFYQISIILKLFIKILKINKKIIFDFDDAIYLHWWDYNITPWIIKQADFVFAGNHFLRDYSTQFNPNVEIIPTSQNLRIYHKLNIKKDKNKFLIGWLGSAKTHFQNLKMLKSVILELLKNNESFHFKLIGALGDSKVYDLFRFNLPHIDNKIEIIDSVPFEKAEKEINMFNIGIVPLEDTPINLGRCASKLLDYMSCGIPSVASNIGEHRFVIQNMKNGILVQTDKEWIDAIEKLSANKTLYEEISKNSLKTIYEKYNLDSTIDHIKNIINKL